jgi:SAM-dependent methyltransferase
MTGQEAYVDLVPLGGARNGALSEASFDRLAAGEEASFWFRSRNRLLLWALDAHFPGASSMLEVGCGTGYVLSAIAASHPGMRVAGSDLSGVGLRHARARLPEATLVRADARELPFEGEFDVVGAFDVLEHVPEDYEVLERMRRALRPGGGVIVTVPQHEWLWSETDRWSGHQRRYSRGELIGKLAAEGFRVRLTTSFVSLLLPLMAASRAWGALAARGFDPGRELAVSPRVDALLERAMRVETAAIAHGMRFPAGGSLLAVAERT